MHRRTALTLLIAAPTGLAACGRAHPARPEQKPVHPGPDASLNALIAHYAVVYDIPESLIHRVVQRESSYNPKARNGPYWGLMQILPQTAATMGHRGPPSELLDADTNLRYAGKYLRGAWLVSDGDERRAVMWYARGYYYEAKRRGLLKETGLRN